MDELETGNSGMEIRLVMCGDLCKIEDDFLWIYYTTRSEWVKIPLSLLKTIEVSKT